MPDVLINGVPFTVLYHHDRRFVRRAGLYAFVHRDGCGGRTVLHLELAEAIHRRACGAHERWDWALSQGMNEVLVHLADEQAEAGVGTTVLFHPETLFHDGREAAPLADLEPTAASASADQPAEAQRYSNALG